MIVRNLKKIKINNCYSESKILILIEAVTGPLPVN